MTPLRAIFNFKVRGMWVRREALDTPFSFERDGRRIAITLPTRETDFQTYRPLEGEYYSALGGGSAGTVDDPKQALGVTIRPDAVRRRVPTHRPTL